MLLLVATPAPTLRRDRELTDRKRIEAELQRIALGDVELSGRAMATRFSALRTVERMSRSDADDEPPAEPQERWDHPVGPDGRFNPSPPEWWPVNLAWRGTAGDPIEAAAIERWRHSVHRARWELAGRPSRSAWEQDSTPWKHALAELES